jgi:hypothetical protein
MRVNDFLARRLMHDSLLTPKIGMQLVNALQCSLTPGDLSSQELISGAVTLDATDVGKTLVANDTTVVALPDPGPNVSFVLIQSVSATLQVNKTNKLMYKGDTVSSVSVIGPGSTLLVASILVNATPTYKYLVLDFGSVPAVAPSLSA